MLDDDEVDVFAEIVDRDLRIEELLKRVGYLERKVEGLEAEDQSREIMNLKNDLSKKSLELRFMEDELSKAKAMYHRSELDKDTRVKEIVSMAEALEKSKQPQQKRQQH